MTKNVAMMKKTYLQPSIELDGMETENMTCTSQDITSNNGITYGGVDEAGEKDPASRRQHGLWEDGALEEDGF